MMLRDGFDPGISVGSASPYDIGRIIVACLEEERFEVEANRIADQARLEDERRDDRYMREHYTFRWPGGSGPTR